MRLSLSLLAVVSLLCLGSCVSNRKATLLQKDDLFKKNLPKDSVVRQYGVGKFEYRVQPNDIISVNFESITPKEFDFLSEVGVQSSTTNFTSANALLVGELVDEKGNIPFPVIGSIRVAGLTIFEIQDTLQSIVSGYLESPVVKVRLLNYRITLLGEVAQEGTVTLGNNRVSLLEAVGLGGGFGEFADRSNVKLIRQINGVTEVQYLDLRDEKFLNSPYYYVYQNDVLVIPPLKVKPFRKYFGQNLSLVVSSVTLLLLTLNLIQ